MNDKTQEFLDHISFKSFRNGEWREAKAVQFADDPRNARAAVLLKQIAADCHEIAPDKWQAIEPHFNPDSKQWLDAVSETCRNVGFKSNVRDFDSYVDHLIFNLSKSH